MIGDGAQGKMDKNFQRLAMMKVSPDKNAIIFIGEVGIAQLLRMNQNFMDLIRNRK
ncbi:MAG: hypothetical protein K2Y01_05815 [Rhabdochlamydiaceae bacterium]|nr:hypothetical protein [Rhabdochlamydiaceae bacterium]